MCGDIESDEARAEEFYYRFVAHAHTLLGAPAEAAGVDPLHAHLDHLFQEALAAAADEDRTPEEVSGYERLKMEPLVYARLAGFMAAHQPLDEDPLRCLIEALMTGYAEGEAALLEPGHDHASGHDHAHTH